MSVTVYAVLGFAMMLILTAVLVSGKFTPSIPMIAVPLIFCFDHEAVFIGSVGLGDKWTAGPGEQRSDVHVCDYLFWRHDGFRRF